MRRTLPRSAMHGERLQVVQEAAVQQAIISGFAWGLSVVLLPCGVAFAWAAEQRGRECDALVAEVARKVAAAPAGHVAAAAPPEAAQVISEECCSRCHEPEETTD